MHKQFAQNQYAWDDAWGVRYNNTYDKEGHLTQRTLASNPKITVVYAWEATAGRRAVARIQGSRGR